MQATSDDTEVHCHICTAKIDLERQIFQKGYSSNIPPGFFNFKFVTNDTELVVKGMSSPRVCKGLVDRF